MTHDQFRELLPLYVIGALDGTELVEFERYVASNRRQCETEIAEWQATADQLAFAAPRVQPPPEIFERVLEAVEPERPKVREYRRPERERFDLSTLFLGWIPWTATAVLCVLLIGAVLTRREAQRRAEEQTNQAAQSRQAVMQQNRQISDLKAQLEERSRKQDELTRAVEQFRASNGGLRSDVDTLKASNQKLIADKAALQERLTRQDLLVASLRGDLDLFTDPATSVVQMADPAKTSKATARVYWHDTKKTGRVVVSNLAPVPQGQGKCLELWAFCGDQPPVPAGLFWTDETGHGVGEVKLAKQIACVSKFAVSVEPDGGVSAPTGPVVLLGQ